jgi:hypothetical protein
VEGIIAVTGFWAVVLAVVLKRPINDIVQAFISHRMQPATKIEIEQLKSKIVDLENQVSSMTMQMIDMKDSHDFALKLLSDSEKGAKKK